MHFTSSQELRDVFTAFLESAVKNEQRGLSGSGLVMAYVVSDPPARIVLDSREPARPGKTFAYSIDDPAAPKAAVDVHLTATTLDQMFSGELNIMVAAAQGKIKSVGDKPAALRMLPVLFRNMSLYKSVRSAFEHKVAS
jgi:hypothetical protein